MEKRIEGGRERRKERRSERGGSKEGQGVEKRRKEWKGGKGEKWDRSNAQIKKKKPLPFTKVSWLIGTTDIWGRRTFLFRCQLALVPTN